MIFNSLKKIKDSQGLVYFGDPMCSWCYGISDVFKNIIPYINSKNIPYEIVLGGLRGANSQAWNEEFRNFLKNHWREVNARTGKLFSYELFNLKSFDYNSHVACQAVVAGAKLMQKEEVYNFFYKIQELFYLHNLDLSKVENYKKLDFNIDFEEFKKLFNSDEVKKETINHFNLCRGEMVHSFPTIIFYKNNEQHIVAQGFASFEVLKNNIDLVLTKG